MLRFLTFDPKERISIEEAIQHNWLKKGFDNDPLVPLTFPSYLTLEELNKNILGHMTNKMQFKEQDVIEGVTNNKYGIIKRLLS
jgi:Neu-associated kinase